MGQRWIVDLGADNYNIPGYFGSGKNGQRWVYYRTRAEGHNTLVIGPGNGPDQDPVSNSKVTVFRSKPESSFAIMDLTPAYAAHASSVKRGIGLVKKTNTVVVEDEIQNNAAADIYWFVHTRAQVELAKDKRSATLLQGGKKLVATLVSPAGATFDIMAAAPLPTSPHPKENNPNEGIRKLSVHMPAASNARIVVVFHPEKGSARNSFTQPLAQW
jgi:hypothetical protein